MHLQLRPNSGPTALLSLGTVPVFDWLRKRGPTPIAGTALRVLRTIGVGPLFRNLLFAGQCLVIAAALGGSLPAESVPIGTQVAGLELEDCQNNRHQVIGPTDSKVTAIIFLGVECPLARLYGGRLCELAQRYKNEVSFIGIDSNNRDDVREIVRWGKEYAPTLLLLRDPNQLAADRLGATRNPEVVLIDQQSRIQYRGRIDGQFTTTAKTGVVDRHDLVIAIEDTLAGKPVSVPITTATGCYIDRRPTRERKVSAKLTYHQQIAPILRRRCVNCHRAGQSAPLELTTYEQVYSWLDTIEEVIRDQRMPPWFANPDHGEFKNFAGLTSVEQDQLFRWIAADGPEGDRITAVALEPLPPSEWNIGEPDLVLPIPEPFTVAAKGIIDYQYFVVDPRFTEDKWVSAVEVRAGNAAVVHHCNVFVQPPTSAKFSLDSWNRLPSSYLAVTAPGRPPMIFPRGMGKSIPARSKLIFQIHYQSIGSVQTDRTRIGLRFADPNQITREVATCGLIAGEEELQIPPGEANYQVQLRQTVDEDLLLLALTPHMHLRGKSCRYSAKYADGSSEVLLDIPSWDFNWQERYVLASPKRLTAGTEIIATAVFDNSTGNPFNPDPTTQVTYGPQSTDEMFNAWYEAVLVHQDLRQPAIMQLIRTVPPARMVFPLAACLALMICCHLLPVGGVKASDNGSSPAARSK